MKKLPLLIALILLACGPVQAQFSKSQFGKNRLQYQRFDWRYISTPNFDIYYYEGGYDLAVLAAKFAEDDLPRVTELVGFAPFSKIKLYIYRSVADLQQSNIGVRQQGVEVGGQTRFVRSEVEVAFTGSKHTMKQELARSIADMLIFEMMYGGSLKELLQSSYLLNLPEWVMAGAAKYIAEGWSADMDNYLRHLCLDGKLKRPDKYMGEDAALVGQSVWNFIAEKYGKGAVGNILNLTRLMRNEEAGIQNTLAISYPRFVQLWQQFYADQAQVVAGSHELPNGEWTLTHISQATHLGQVRISPDRQWVAFTENVKGRYHVRLHHLESGKARTLLSGGYKVISQQANLRLPLICWKDANTLAVVTTRSGINTLGLYDIGKGKRTHRQAFSQFSHINGIDIDEAGETLVMSAEADTHSDIYVYSFRSRRISAITRDFFDDRDPRFLPGGEVAFASNRNNDTLGVDGGSVRDISENFHIFRYRPGQPVLQRITNTYSQDSGPMPDGQGGLLFLSDQRGIAHLYAYDAKNGTAQQVSRFALDLRLADVRGDLLAFAMLQDGQAQVFAMPGFDRGRASFTEKTPRQQLRDLRMLERLKEQRKAAEQAQQQAQQQADSAAAPAKTPPPAPETTEEPAESGDYTFDSFGKTKRKRFTSKFQNRPASVQSDIDGMRVERSKPYESAFTTDNFVTSLVIDPLRSVYGSGLGVLFEIDMTDLRENHKVNGGLFGLTNLNNSVFYAEYEYLRRRIDYRVRYDMRNLEIATDVSGFFQRYKLNSVEASASYPLNITTRLTAAPFFVHTRYLIAGTSALLGRPDVTHAYGGGKLSFVFDNSRITGMNMILGTKMRANFAYYAHFGDSQQDFSNLELEVRHYQKVYKSLVLAMRLGYGQFFGPAAKQYILGGMDNWIGSDTELRGGNDILTVEPEQGVARDMSHLLFSKFVTSMRGFNYNAMNGNSHLLFNAELRLPLLRFFYKGTVASSFFRNLQLVGFTDVGAAWTGTGPFQRKNAVNTVTIPKQGGFSGSVTNFSNPFLIGYGFGARTMVLSYYMKFDVAWGVEEKTRGDAKFYVTLGYDF